MMKETTKLSFIAILVIVAVVAVVLSIATSKKPMLGSVSVGSDYYSTTTDATFSADPSWKLLKTGYGTLGSVIITNKDSQGQALITLYDATTTVNGAVYGTTTLAKFGTTSPEGTYVFDTVFKYGLVLQLSSGTFASSTITWR